MFAVIETGGKQYKVAEGQTLQVERLGSDDDVSFTPLLLVDGDTVLSVPDELTGASVAARIVGPSKGPKIRALTYKNKSRSARRWGHRQHYTTIEITGISRG